MSNLRALIKKSKSIKNELIASTVRLPKELHSFVDELAEHLSLSRQEVLFNLINEGASVAKDELNPNAADDSQPSGRFHLLNTNKGNNDEDQEEMIAEGIAAAFYGQWKYNIDRIKEGDWVFLYENGVGVIAYGKGTGETLVREHEGQKEECRYQKLGEFSLVSEPITASAVKKILGRNVVFLRTMSGMPDGQKLLDRILEQKS
jgi:hypothetical protein